MSTQKLRRSFRNKKNQREHQYKQRKDDLDGDESKLESLRKEFDSCLKKLIEFEELNIFSRDDDNTISNILIENKILNGVLIQYENLLNEEKVNYSTIQELFLSICGEINENIVNLNDMSKDIETFYDGIDTQFLNEENFRNKIIEKLNKLNEEIKNISPLIYGKNIESPLKIAILFSNIYAMINLEKKQYGKIKKELKKLEHDKITTNGNNNNNDYYDDDIFCNKKPSKYKSTDLKQIEYDINKLRKKKSDSMKKLIERVYHNKYNKKYIKNLKLKQVDLHYKDSIIDDNKISLKLQYELLEIQCEEFQNKLILLEKRKEINEAKQQQLKNTLNLYLQSQQYLINNKNESISTKQISRDAMNELKKLQKLEREQRNAISLTEKEIRKIDKLIYQQRQKQKSIQRNKQYAIQRQKSFNLQSDDEEDEEHDDEEEEEEEETETEEEDDDEDDEEEEEEEEEEKDGEMEEKLELLRNEFCKYNSERQLLEEKWEKNNDLIDDKKQKIMDLQNGIIESQESKKELQKMIHQYENSIHSNKYKYLSENASRKNSESLEFIEEMNFRNKEYQIKIDQINNKYRERQTILKNKFISEFNNKIKKNTKNRQTEIEQESYNIINQRGDPQQIKNTQTINQQNIDQQMLQQFDNKTKPVKIKFGKKIISSNNNNDNNDDFHVLQPISFIWNEFEDDKQDKKDVDDNNRENKDDTDDTDHIDTDNTNDDDDNGDITTDLSFDDDDDDDEEEEEDKMGDLNYNKLVDEVMSLLDKNDLDIYDVLSKKMENDDKEEILDIDNNCEIETEYLRFDVINPMKELLMNWTLNNSSNLVK